LEVPKLKILLRIPGFAWQIWKNSFSMNLPGKSTDLPGKSGKTGFHEFARQIHGFAWQICKFTKKTLTTPQLQGARWR